MCQDKRSKVIATVGVDSIAAFQDLSYGANDAAASIAALLGAAEAIGRIDHSSFALQPLFFFANAEEWGLSGSRRFVRDIYSFDCDNNVSHNETRTGLPLCAAPVYPSTLFQHILNDENEIKGIIALDQIGISNGAFTLHSLQHNDVISSVIQKAAMDMDGVSVSLSGISAIPPTPMTSFVRQFKSLINGVVIAGYGDAYNDPRFHTRLDNGTLVNVDDVIK